MYFVFLELMPLTRFMVCKTKIVFFSYLIEHVDLIYIIYLCRISYVLAFRN